MTLKDWLAARSITQQAFAQRIDRSTATVSRLVNGKDQPSRETAIRIMRETDGEVTPTDFLGLDNVGLREPQP